MCTLWLQWAPGPDGRATGPKIAMLPSSPGEVLMCMLIWVFIYAAEQPQAQVLSKIAIVPSSPWSGMLIWALCTVLTSMVLGGLWAGK